jgi:hypothetical protein
MVREKIEEEKEEKRLKLKNAQRATGGVLIFAWTILFFILFIKVEWLNNSGVFGTLIWFGVLVAIAFASRWTERP